MASTARNLFQNLPPPAECLALLIGTAELTVFGLGGFANPAQFATGFGIPLLPASATQKHPGAIESSPEEIRQAKKVEDTQKALITAIAARNVQNGLLILTFGAWYRDRKALGILTAFGLVTTATDYFVVKSYGVREAASGHLIGVLNCLLIGSSLLFWGREDPWW
ncbi:uncharacterized protein PV09_02020 [Verruconis gallopava]|uniref:Uncharacterized protein n=1 Tax=Verruconis gallopava TaxID=253628 RepID=A0A0D2AKR1_9PEZI|nr:uncharacterized protein PV09_02020 [Verruconis gallopava]KIW07150.1 hypothetical protein PV09_02020 [Verruconis gallopava]